MSADPKSSGLRIALVAGESSGDHLAAHLMAALKEKLPQVSFVGIGGTNMRAQGMEIWWPLEKLAVMGYVEVLKRYREISSIRRALKARLLSEKPDLFIGVDAPDFNLDLEIALRTKGVKTMHYVSPSIWAWRGGRIKKIAKAADRVLALFPMEPPLYKQAGIPVTYVGHPLADQISSTTDKRAMREKLGLPQDKPVYALLPGSRQSEVESLGETFIRAARLLHERVPNALFLVPLITRETRLAFEVARYKQAAQDLPFHIVFGHTKEAMGAADAVLVASGTATLEAALIKRPMVIAYKLSPLTYKLMKRRALLPYVGLPNILAGRFIVPELLQDEATPEKLADALLKEAAPERASELDVEFARIHNTLRQNTAEKAAAAVLDVLNQK
ncbi:MAG: lipid-A-disaccharide synthase [Zoogloeaceae bacterium]|jgi:lipid-A-disaccharide synthase|nr:lipid-A-disaccharide synthase [Zoogloeaceae bacterium]